MVVGGKTGPLNRPLKRTLRSIHRNGFWRTFPMHITPIRPLHRPKNSTPPLSHTTEVIAASHLPHAHSEGDPWQTRLQVFKHHTNTSPLVQPTAMSVPSGLMARVVGRLFVGTWNAWTTRYVRCSCMMMDRRKAAKDVSDILPAGGGG